MDSTLNDPAAGCLAILARRGQVFARAAVVMAWTTVSARLAASSTAFEKSQLVVSEGHTQRGRNQ